jgi:DNA mismatch repair protein MLH1
VSRYAIHNYHVSFFLKRLGENNVDLKSAGCTALANKTRCEENETILLDNISLVYGNECRKELERIALDYDANLKYEMTCYASNSKYTKLRQMVFILFINERLVDCQPIRKAINTVYGLYMPKNTNYFVYMNLVMNPKNLDVNIHPTKHEVRFLYQDEIIAKIQACFEEKMINSSVSRVKCLLFKLK